MAEKGSMQEYYDKSLAQVAKNRAADALRGKKSTPSVPKKVTIERTANDKFVATHHAGDGSEPKVHAIDSGGLADHISQAFNLGAGNEGAAIKAKKENVEQYDKARPDNPLLPK